MTTKLTKPYPTTFIGPLEVAKVEPTEQEYLVRVTYTDGTWEELNKDIYDASVTDTISDLSLLREKRMKVAAEAILTLMLHYNVKVTEVQYLTTVVIDSVNHNLDKVDAKLWKREGETERILHQRSMVDIDRLLKAGVQ